MRRPLPYDRGISVRTFGFLALLGAAQLACGQKSVTDAEGKRDVAWLAANPSGESIAALGRLADTDERALAALQARADQDVNTYIAAWSAVTRNAPWGAAFLRRGLADPARAETASSAMPRKDPHLAAFVPDLEGAVVRLAAGRRGSLIAGIVASVGPAAHAAVERRLNDPKTRSVMCDGIALPEASGDAKSVLLAVPLESRDSPSCVTTVIDMAATEDVVANWLGASAEPGLLGVAAKSTLPCPRLATIWKTALADRGPPQQGALTVPLQRSISRCASALDPVLGELLAKTPRSRSTIVRAIDPYGVELRGMKETCTALAGGYLAGEPALVRGRASEAAQRGCAFAR